ncbi:MAG: hypothetical protein E7523_08280 [Ruminococcaceae bacterium]|nr:hypothetical protein [Oscillospiraceae bacterium]
MHTCTFFGHRNTPSSAAEKLKKTIINLIKKENVTCFYVGNHGKYDEMVTRILKELKKEYPQITYAIVLAYIPSKKEFDSCDYSVTIFPEGLETVPPRFAINKRNEWMLKRSDYVISYVEHKIGGAATYTEKAIKKGKIVINLTDNT